MDLRTRDERDRHSRRRARQAIPPGWSSAERFAARSIEPRAEIASVGVPPAQGRNFLGFERRLPGSSGRRSARAYWTKRSGQDHAAENPVAHHAADYRLGGNYG